MSPSKQTMAWFNSLVRWAKDHDRDWHEGDDVAAKIIRALIRQKRTVVSEEQIGRWAHELFDAGNERLPVEKTMTKLIKILSELGHEVTP